MNDYKLVPVEPTAEMVEAAESAYMPFGDMELAIRMAVLAAPDVQGEPDTHSFLEYPSFEESANFDPVPAVQGEPVDWKDGYRAAMNEAGWAVRELYVNHVHHTGVDGLLKRCQELEQSFICSAEAAPQPTEQQPDVTQLVEALEEIDAWVSRWCADDHPVAGFARKALAAHRKGGAKP